MWKYFFLVAFIAVSFDTYAQNKPTPEGFELVSLDGKDAYLNLETGEIKLINANNNPVVNVENKVANSTVTLSTSDKFHTVKKGETLYQIARIYDVTVRDISANNRFDREIYPGQKIIISKGNNIKNSIKNTNSNVIHVVEKGETLYRISVNNNLSVSRLKELNQLSDNTILVGQRLKLK